MEIKWLEENRKGKGGYGQYAKKLDNTKDIKRIKKLILYLYYTKREEKPNATPTELYIWPKPTLSYTYTRLLEKRQIEHVNQKLEEHAAFGSESQTNKNIYILSNLITEK